MGLVDLLGAVHARRLVHPVAREADRLPRQPVAKGARLAVGGHDGPHLLEVIAGMGPRGRRRLDQMRILGGEEVLELRRGRRRERAAAVAAVGARGKAQAQAGLLGARAGIRGDDGRSGELGSLPGSDGRSCARSGRQHWMCSGALELSSMMVVVMMEIGSEDCTKMGVSYRDRKHVVRI